MKKFVTLAEAARIAGRAKKAGKRVVTTNGCFDILHVGHVRNLAAAKRLGDILIVGINSDASTRTLKGAGRPLVPERERVEMLAALSSVDYVFIFSDPTPVDWLEKIRPAVHVKGSDRKLRTGKLLESAVVEQYGGKVVLFPHTGHSSTALSRKLKR